MSVHRLRVLHNAAKEVGLLRTEEEIAGAAIRQAQAAFADHGCVVLLADPSQPSDFLARAGSALAETPHPILGATVSVHCLVQNQRALGIRDLRPANAAASKAYAGYSFAPLEVAGSILGLLGVSRPPESLEVIDLELLCGLASVAAVAIEQARLQQQAILEERQRVRLARYFSPQVTRYLLSAGGGDLSRGVRCEATVLVSDIRGFTALTEHRDPSEVLGILNEYFGKMTALVFDHGGMIDKLMGDGLLAVFGAPQPLAAHALAALRCAAAMIRTVRSLELSRFGVDGLRIGIGVHTGPVLLGDLGGESFLDFTVLGATVNLASRLEALTKTVGGDVLLSEETRRRAGSGAGVRPVGATEVRGSKRPSSCTNSCRSTTRPWSRSGRARRSMIPNRS